MKKIFISSTAYKLRDLRAEIVNLLHSKDYEVLYHESSHFPVEKGMHSHDVCLDAVKKCDIYILIIDYRYGQEYCGTKYKKEDISITWYEYKTALKEKKKIYVFVRDNVFNERISFKNNLSPKTYKPTHTDNIKTFEFIDFITQQPKENWLNIFSDSIDLKKRINERLSFYSFYLKVIYYGTLPNVINKEIKINIWTRRPSSYHIIKGFYNNSFLEDMIVYSLLIEGYEMVFSGDLFIFFENIENKQVIDPKWYTIKITGSVISSGVKENCNMLEIGINKKMYSFYQKVLKNEQKYSSSNLMDAIRLNHKNEVYESIAKSNLIIKNYVKGINENIAERKKMRKVVEACDSILAMRMKHIMDQHYWDGEQQIVEYFKTITDSIEIFPKKIKNELVNILIECLPDQGRLYGGSVCSYACNALIRIKSDISLKQRAFLIKTFDFWLGDTDISLLDDAAFCLIQFNNWVPNALRGKIITKLKSIILYHDQPEPAVFYIAKAILVLSKGKSIEQDLKEKINLIMRYESEMGNSFITLKT
jgi:hypothetical protein